MNRVAVGTAVAVGLVVAVVGGLAAVVEAQPSHVHVERTAVIAAQPKDVFPFAHDFDLWMKWNPWEAMEPTAKKEFSENRVGPGAWYTWKGEQVGAGKMTIASSEAPTKVVYDLEFTEPFTSSADITMTFSPVPAGTSVVWSYDAEAGFLDRGIGLVMDMDGMLGGDFDKGLASLKPLAEAAATARVAIEANPPVPPPVDPSAAAADPTAAAAVDAVPTTP
jgi:uncharacterized protein YndB with AHSA1/START domain